MRQILRFLEDVFLFDIIKYVRFMALANKMTLRYLLFVIQIFAKLKDEEGLAWCPALIKMLKGEFAVVDLPSGGTDILPLDRIRAVNLK